MRWTTRLKYRIYRFLGIVSPSGWTPRSPISMAGPLDDDQPCSNLCSLCGTTGNLGGV